MVAKSTTDILALGIFLMSVFVLILSLRESRILMLLGFVGSLIVIVTEAIFLIQKFKK